MTNDKPPSSSPPPGPPLYEGSGAQAMKGGYVISAGKKDVPDVILMASGSRGRAVR
jgi:transketolase